MQYLILRDCAGRALLQVSEEPYPMCVAQWPLNTMRKRNYVHTELHGILQKNYRYGSMFENAAFYDYDIEKIEYMLNIRLAGWFAPMDCDNQVRVGLQYSNTIALNTLQLVCKVGWMGIKFLAIMVTLPFVIMFFKKRD